MSARARTAPPAAPPRAYVLDAQIGFLLRQVGQRHAAIFMAGIGEGVTMTQWAALAKLQEAGPLSQNLLGRMTYMDAATIKGVIDRLTERGLTQTNADPSDARRRLVSLTAEGSALVERCEPAALAISEETVVNLDPQERATLTSLLLRMR